MSKTITFSEYRYHLLPLETEQTALELHGPKPSFEELRETKNKIFEEIIQSLPETKKEKNLFKLLDNTDSIYLFKVSNKKYDKIVEDFTEKEIKTEPYVYLIVNNDPNVQKIYISEDIEVFTSVNATKNILITIFRKYLHTKYLNIETNEVFDKKTFWTLVKRHQGKIKYINIEMIKPNLANISKSLPEAFKKFAENTNAHRSNIILKAPENGKLEKINESNKELEGLVDYSSKGGGEIKVKVKGISKQLKTSDNIKKIDIEQIYLEGSHEQVIKMYKEILKS